MFTSLLLLCDKLIGEVWEREDWDAKKKRECILSHWRLDHGQTSHLSIESGLVCVMDIIKSERVQLLPALKIMLEYSNFVKTAM